MESLAYQQLALISEPPTDRKWFQGLNWEKLSTQGFIRFLSLFVLLSGLSLAQSSLAQSFTGVNFLQRGDSGPAVSELQRQLQVRGYFNANITGFYGPITQDAVRRFQRDNRISATGQADFNTQSLLFGQQRAVLGTSTRQATIVAQRGDRSPTVAAIQQQLAIRGYFTASVTSFYGPITEDAVRRFQRDNALPQTGVVDSVTYSLLLNLTPVNPPPRILKLGDIHSEVGVIQERLQVLGYYSRPINNTFDGSTQQAVLRFQQVNRITPTGQVGPTTRAILFSSGAIRNPITFPGASSVPSLPTGVVKTAIQRVSSIPGLSSGIIIQFGDTGPDVGAIQRRLQDLGFYNGQINNFFDRTTQLAVINFQEARGITPVSGRVGPTTRAYLFGGFAKERNPLAVGLRLGDTGYNVRLLQSYLTRLGYLSSPIDGAFGPETETAVRQFQLERGLPQTGFVSQNTLSTLQNCSCFPQIRTATSDNNALASNRARTLEVQRRLNLYRLYSGPLNGIYNAETQQAVARATSIYGVSEATVLFGL